MTIAKSRKYSVNDSAYTSLTQRPKFIKYYHSPAPKINQAKTKVKLAVKAKENSLEPSYNSNSKNEMKTALTSQMQSTKKPILSGSIYQGRYMTNDKSSNEMYSSQETFKDYLDSQRQQRLAQIAKVYGDMNNGQKQKNSLYKDQSRSKTQHMKEKNEIYLPSITLFKSGPRHENDSKRII